MPKWLAWLITFNFVSTGFVFFRAPTFADAIRMLKSMAGLSGTRVPVSVMAKMTTFGGFISALGDLFERIGKVEVILGMFVVFLPLSFLFRNSNEMVKTFALIAAE